MAYGPDPIEQYEPAAIGMDSIFKGTKPADLRVERPTKSGFIERGASGSARLSTAPPQDTTEREHP